MKYFLIYITICASVLSSCVSPKETNLLQNLNTDYPIRTYEEYKLSIGDVINCAIYTKDAQYAGVLGQTISTSEFATNPFVIHDNGCVTLPFFGDVKITNLTLQEAEIVIQKRMEESITDVQVRVRMTNRFFYILSDGQRGRFQIYKDNMTIFQALAISGGTYNQRLDFSKVNILRRGENGESILKTFDLRTQDIIQSEFYYIQPNDLIYYPTSKKSFFNINSFGSFQSFVMMIGSLAFLIFTASYKF